LRGGGGLPTRRPPERGLRRGSPDRTPRGARPRPSLARRRGGRRLRRNRRRTRPPRRGGARPPPRRPRPGGRGRPRGRGPTGRGARGPGRRPPLRRRPRSGSAAPGGNPPRRPAGLPARPAPRASSAPRRSFPRRGDPGSIGAVMLPVLLAAAVATSAVPSIAERVEAASAPFVGAPYRRSPLGEGEGIDPDARYREDAFDCLTLVETAIALAHRSDRAQAARILDDIRYADGGPPSYERRLHLMEAQWIPDL